MTEVSFVIPKQRVRPKADDSRTFLLGVTDILFSPNRSFLLCADFVVLAISFVVFHWLSPWGKWGRFTAPQLTGALSFAVSFCLVGLGLGYYERTRRHKLVKVVVVGLLGLLLALPIGLSVVYFLYYEVVGRLTFLWGAVGAYLCLSTFRLLLVAAYKRIPYRFTTLGQSPVVDVVRDYCQTGRTVEARAFRYISPEKLCDQSGELDMRRMRRLHVGDLVVARSALASIETQEVALLALRSRIRVIDEIEFYADMFEQLPIDAIERSWVILNGLSGRSLFGDGARRAIDIVISLVGLVIGSPVILAIALAIKLSSPGPVFFLQERQGRFSVPFRMFKFRTMRQEVSRSDASAGFTAVGDSRVTWIGRIIRPLHLDELPQLLNVLLGEMSIVGPRPEALAFAKSMAEKIPLYDIRYLLRPGLTGHAQIMKGYALDTVDETKGKLAFDLYYVCKQNVLLDIRIIIRTAFIVLKQGLIGIIRTKAQ